MNRKFLDLVVGGPDMSGTSTQIEDIIEYFQNRGQIVKDIRGTEIDALFHSEKFQDYVKLKWNREFLNFSQFIEAVESNQFSISSPRDFLYFANGLLSGGGTNQDLRIASMIKNDVSTYIDYNSADVWIMEEPSKRGAGQVCRVIDQNRSKYGSSMNGKAAAEAHSVYRTDEFLRFRKPLGENGKIIIRSRSEESACYQIEDKNVLPSGVPRDYYLNLEGHKIAFANAPTHIFVVCGPKDWTEQDYMDLKNQRSGGRMQDDYEKDALYQVLVNNRYATDWLEKLYEEGCSKIGGKVPIIKRFNIYDSKEEIKKQMNSELEKIIL